MMINKTKMRMRKLMTIRLMKRETIVRFAMKRISHIPCLFILTINLT